MCGKKSSNGYKGDTLWWKEEAKEAISRKNDARKKMRRNSNEETKNMYKRMKNKAKKAVLMAMR